MITTQKFPSLLLQLDGGIRLAIIEAVEWMTLDCCWVLLLVAMDVRFMAEEVWGLVVEVVICVGMELPLREPPENKQKIYGVGYSLLYKSWKSVSIICCI